MIYTHEKYNLPKIRYTFPVADIEVSPSRTKNLVFLRTIFRHYQRPRQYNIYIYK